MKLNNKIKFLVVGLTLFASAAAIVVTNSVNIYPHLMARSTQNNFTFNSQTGSTYWSSNKNEKKVITRTDNPSNNIWAGQVVHGYDCRTNYGAGGSFLKFEYAISNENVHYQSDQSKPKITTYQFIAGVNNLQSFSMLFHAQYNTEIYSNPDTFNYTIKATFYGADFDLDWYLRYENGGSGVTKLADPIEFYSDSISNQQQYEAAWTKTNEQYVIRYVVFFVEIKSKNNSVNPQTYFDWYFESLTLDWSC